MHTYDDRVKRKRISNTDCSSMSHNSPLRALLMQAAETPPGGTTLRAIIAGIAVSIPVPPEVISLRSGPRSLRQTVRAAETKDEAMTSEASSLSKTSPLALSGMTAEGVEEDLHSDRADHSTERPLSAPVAAFGSPVECVMNAQSWPGSPHRWASHQHDSESETQPEGYSPACGTNNYWQGRDGEDVTSETGDINVSGSLSALGMPALEMAPASCAVTGRLSEQSVKVQGDRPFRARQQRNGQGVQGELRAAEAVGWQWMREDTVDALVQQLGKYVNPMSAPLC